MLRVLVLGAQFVVLAFAAYSVIIALWGWRDPVAAPIGRRDRKFRVVVPAHDEGIVIEAVLGDLASQDYSHRRVVVIADRCTDDTAARAATLADVAVRTDGPDGKGAAIDWHLRHDPLGDEDLVVLDADARVPPHLLSRFADELDAGNDVLQAYLDVSNPDASLLATAEALSYWASNRMVQLARHNLGWSVDLGGTGMCFTAAALDRAGGFSSGLTEDEDLGVRLVLTGSRVAWLHDLHIGDEKPARFGSAVRQRARWAAGRRAVARGYALPLLRSGLRRGVMSHVDQAIRLIRPSRTMIALLSALLAVAAAVADSDLLLPWQLWAAAAAIQVLAPIPFLARDGVPTRYLVRYPVLTLLAALWLPVRLVSRFAGGGWYHTPHRGDR